MFHFSNDKRALESAELLRKALVRQLDEKSFEHIGVTDLCREAGVSRTTFYRLFDTPSDIIRWNCEVSVQSLVAEYKEQAGNPRGLFRFNIRHIFEHPDAMILAYRAERLDIADSTFQRHMGEFLEPHMSRDGISESDMRYSHLIASGIIGAAFKAWYEQGMQESAAAVCDRLARIYNVIK